MLFAKLKALLRKAAERTIASLWDAIGRLLDNNDAFTHDLVTAAVRSRET